MKPMGYLVTEHETGRVVFTKHSPSPEDMQEFELTCTLVYTADQLAEAVAAERERCIRIVRSEGITPHVPDDPSEEAEAVNYALHHIIQAIRSVAK